MLQQMQGNSGIQISPKYIMLLIEKIQKAIWKEFESYTNVKHYIKKWHIIYDNFGEENFTIFNQDDTNNIELKKTLHNIDAETLLKIAIDLEIETPGFIPVVSSIKNKLKNGYKAAFKTFKKAIQKSKEDPALAIELANSSLESIIKHILEHKSTTIKWNKKDTLYDLTQCVLKEFKMFPLTEMPLEIKTIGSSLLKLTQHIEKLRSEKTFSHGKLKDDYIIEDSIYADFVINSVTTIGLFLIEYFEKQIKLQDSPKTTKTDKIEVDDIPF